jgi:hypothetical protein
MNHSVLRLRRQDQFMCHFARRGFCQNSRPVTEVGRPTSTAPQASGSKRGRQLTARAATLDRHGLGASLEISLTPANPRWEKRGDVDPLRRQERLRLQRRSIIEQRAEGWSGLGALEPPRVTARRRRNLKPGLAAVRDSEDGQRSRTRNVTPRQWLLQQTLRHLVLFVLVSFMAPRTADAAPPWFSASVLGNCPARDELVASLSAKGYAFSAAGQPTDYQIVAQTEPTGAVLVLSRGNGNRLMERRFESSDCHALADAMVVVVEAYFVEVGVLASESPSAPASTASSDASSARSTAAGTTAPSDGRDVASSTATRVAAGGPSTAPAPMNGTTIALRAGRVSLREPAASAMSGRWLVGFGPVLTLPDKTVTPTIEMGGGVAFPRIPLSSELVLSAGLASTTTNKSPDRVQRWASHGLLRLGVPWAAGLQYRPWAGIGLSVTRLRDVDLPDPRTKTSLRAIAAAGFEVAWPMGNGWSARADLGCLLTAMRDDYKVGNESIGNGPLVVCSTTFGFAYSLFRASDIGRLH